MNSTLRFLSRYSLLHPFRLAMVLSITFRKKSICCGKHYYNEKRVELWTHILQLKFTGVEWKSGWIIKSRYQSNDLSGFKKTEIRGKNIFFLNLPIIVPVHRLVTFCVFLVLNFTTYQPLFDYLMSKSVFILLESIKKTLGAFIIESTGRSWSGL